MGLAKFGILVVRREFSGVWGESFAAAFGAILLHGVGVAFRTFSY